MNRRLDGQLADLALRADRGRRRQPAPRGRRRGPHLVTGNTVVDALRSVVAQLELHPAAAGRLPPSASRPPPGARHHPPARELRRRPAQHLRGAARSGRPPRRRATSSIPVHLNPAVAGAGARRCSARTRASVLTPPLDYLPFVDLMRRAHLDPHRLRRRPGGGAVARQAGAGDARRPPSAPRGSTPAPRALVGTDRDAIVAAAARPARPTTAHARCARRRIRSATATPPRIVAHLEAALEHKEQE